MATLLPKDKHKGATCLIVGKGPSLDKLVPQSISKDWIVFFCNDAYLELENEHVYCVQMDRTLGDVLKDRKHRIVTSSTLELYPEQINTYVYTLRMAKPSRLNFAVILAIEAAKYMGGTYFVLTGFDGAFGGDCEYAKKIGYSAKRGGKIERFRSHKNDILRCLEDYKWRRL